MTAPASITSRLRGALSAIITPFDERGELDLKALARLVDVQIERGINGLVACGTTGETPTLNEDEQERVIRTVVEVTGGRVPVIAGTGSNDTRATVEKTQRASKWGVDAALVVCPYYNKPTQEGLFRHFEAAGRDGGLPVVAYNVPGRTVSDLLPETLARLVEARAVVAIKDATADMIRTTETLSALPAGADFALLSGDDFTILPFVACGGQGVISVVSNICPGDTARLVKLAAAADYDAARPLHARLVALSRAMFCSSNPIPVKAALAMGGWCEASTRLPLEGADEAVRSTVRSALEAYAPGQSLDGFMC